MAPDSAEASDAAVPGLHAVSADVRYLVDLVADGDNFDAFKRPLNELAGHALVPAVGTEFAWSKAALRHLRKDAGESGVALVWRHCAAHEGDEFSLVGAFSQNLMHPLPGFSVSQAGTWKHIFSFLGAPLLHRNHAEDALRAYFDWCFATGPKVSSVVLQQIPTEGPFAQAFDAALEGAGLPMRQLDIYERAVLDVPDSVEDYLVQSLPRKKRKEFRRLRARLGEQGELQFEQFSTGCDLSRWLNDFYALEGRGWKGRNQTSLSCDPAWSGFFDTAFAELAEAGNALAWKLSLDGIPVAMTLGIKSGRCAWLCKIAYDEAHARSSPGVLLVLDVMQAVSDGGEIDVIDSCAHADHPMINHLWRERLCLRDVMIGKPAQPQLVMQTLYELTRFKREGREITKRLYKTYLKGGAK